MSLIMPRSNDTNVDLSNQEDVDLDLESNNGDDGDQPQ